MSMQQGMAAVSMQLITALLPIEVTESVTQQSHTDHVSFFRDNS